MSKRLKKVHPCTIHFLFTNHIPASDKEHLETRKMVRDKNDEFFFFSSLPPWFVYLI